MRNIFNKTCISSNYNFKLNYYIICRSFTLINFNKFKCSHYNKIDYEKDYLNLDYYTLLNSNINSSSKEIKKNYIKLTKKFHPDIYKGNTNIIQKLNEAYKTLSNNDLKEKYNKRAKFKQIYKRGKYRDATKDKYSNNNNCEQNNYKINEEDVNASKYANDFNKINKNKLLTKFINSRNYIESDFSEFKVYKTDLEKQMNKREHNTLELFNEIDYKNNNKKYKLGKYLYTKYLNSNKDKNPFTKLKNEELEKEKNKSYEDLTDSYNININWKKEKKEEKEKINDIEIKEFNYKWNLKYKFIKIVSCFIVSTLLLFYLFKINVTKKYKTMIIKKNIIEYMRQYERYY